MPARERLLGNITYLFKRHLNRTAHNQNLLGITIGEVRRANQDCPSSE